MNKINNTKNLINDSISRNIMNVIHGYIRGKVSYPIFIEIMQQVRGGVSVEMDAQIYIRVRNRLEIGGTIDV